MRAVSVLWSGAAWAAWPSTLSLRHGCSDNVGVSGDCCRGCLRRESGYSNIRVKSVIVVSAYIYEAYPVCDRFPQISSDSVNSELDWRNIIQNYPHTHRSTHTRKSWRPRKHLVVMAITRRMGEAMQSANLMDNSEIRGIRVSDSLATHDDCLKPR
jgi:hypothetical protein